jgi:high-affinity Fe2+/Pb2+ permease
VITDYLELKLIVLIVALGVSVYMWWWRRRSRAEWRAYDEAHPDDPPLKPTGASTRAGLVDKE